MPGRPPNVLLVEDDDVDVMVVRRAFRKRQMADRLFVARDGIEALEVLRGVGDRPPLPRPYLILLDLNMPRMNGLEFLDELRRDPVHGTAVVFVLTTSDSRADVDAAYRRHVAGYVVKADIGRYGRLAELVDTYGDISELPD